MKTFRGIGFGAVATVLSAGVWFGCSSDDTSTGGPAADAGGSDSTVKHEAGASDGGSTPETGVVAETGSPEAATGVDDASDGGGADASTDGGLSLDAGDSSAPDAQALSCAAYCTAIAAACTGTNAQYATTAECMQACALTPVGEAGAMAGDTLACRTYHAGLAATLPNPHCWHAGPYGFGVCGDECASFCRLAFNYCEPSAGFEGGAPPYASLAACTTACPGFTMVNGGDAGLGLEGGYYAGGPTGGPTLDCREYHLGAALQSTALQQVHCNHPGVVSPTCN